MKGITKRGKNYRFTVSMGYDGDYQLIRKYLTYTPPEGVSPERADRLAEEAYLEFKQCCKGEKSLNEAMRFRDLATLYFKEYAPNKLKEVTAYNYEIAVRTHINPKFGNYKLRDITTYEISNFLTALNIKGATSRKVKIVLHSILQYAVAQRITKSNPCIGAIWKKEEEEGNPKYLSIQQGKKLMKLVEDYSVFHTIVKVLLMTGMRSGECLGLRWDCINFEDRTITVNRTLAYANNRWYLDSPKSKNSRRTMEFDDKLYEILLKHKEEQDKAKAIVGDAWQQPDLVFTSCTGHWYDRSLLNTQFRRFMKSHTEFPYITIHGLRHTYAALLIYEKETIEVVSKQLGHSSVDITSRVYSHLLSEVKVRVAKSVSSALFD